MATNTKPVGMTDLRGFFSAAEARIDRWRELSAVGRAWEAAVAQGQSGDAGDADHAPAARLLAEIRPLEAYWAYPGPRLVEAVDDALQERNAAVIARLALKLSTALLNGSYRHDTGAWDPLEEGESRVSDALPPDARPADGHKQ
jgi:arginine decarboxylase